MSSFTTNVLKLTLGNITAQVISIVSIPIITRIYSPYDYGIFAIYMSIVAILAPISTLHFHRAMLLPDNRNDAINLLGLSFLSAMAFSIIVLIFISLVCFSGFLPNEWIKKGAQDFLWIVPLGVLIQGSALIIQFWALKYKMFNNLALARVTESVTDRSFVIATGFLISATPIGLIGGRILGPFIALLSLAYQTFSHEIKFLFKNLSFIEMRRLSLRYKEFPLYSTSAFIANSIARQAPTLLLAVLFPTAVVGFYGLVVMMIRMPMALIGDAISKVFFQRATENFENHEMVAKDSTLLVGYMIYLLFPAIMVLLCFGEEIFSSLFGSSWQEAGHYAQILCLSFLPMFMFRPLSILFDAYKRQKQMLKFNSLLLIVRGVSVVGGAYFSNYSVSITFTTLAIFTFITYTYGIFYLFTLVSIRPTKVLWIFWGKISKMAPLLIGLPLLNYFLQDNHLTILMGLLILLLLMLQTIIILLFEPFLMTKLHIIRNNIRFNEKTA